MGRVVNFRPLVCCGLSIAAGIVFSSLLVGKSLLWSLIPIAAGAVAAITVYFLKKKTSVLVFGAIFILLFFTGALSVGILTLPYGKLDEKIVGASFEGTVRSIVSYDEEKNETCVLLSDVDSDDFSIGRGRILTYVEGRCEIGDRFALKATLEKNELNIGQNFYFSERIFYSSTSIQTARNVTSSTDFFYKVRKGIRSVLRDNLSKDAYAFTASMLLGESEALSDSVRENFGAAGVSHVFAVSGLHVTFFAAIIGLLLSLIGIKRLKKDVIVLIMALLYSGVCGFPVSSLRAVITFFVLGAARSLGFKRDGLSATFLSMTIVLLIMPTSLFSFGFLLSFAAVIGIAVFGTSFKLLFGFMPESLSSIFAISLSAFLTTAPIVARMLGTVSLVTVLSNAVIVPVVTVVFYVTIISVAVTAIVPLFSGVFFLVEALVSFVLGVTNAIDFGRFLIYGHMSIFNMIFYYLMLLIACEKVNLKKPVKSVAAVAASLSLLLFI